MVSATDFLKRLEETKEPWEKDSILEMVNIEGGMCVRMHINERKKLKQLLLAIIDKIDDDISLLKQLDNRLLVTQGVMSLNELGEWIRDHEKEETKIYFMGCKSTKE